MSSGDHGREKILRIAHAKEIAIEKMKPRRARLRCTKKKKKGLSREEAKSIGQGKGVSPPRWSRELTWQSRWGYQKGILILGHEKPQVPNKGIWTNGCWKVNVQNDGLAHDNELDG